MIVRAVLLGVCVGALLTSAACAKKAYETRILSEKVVVRENDDRKSKLESRRDAVRRSRAGGAQREKNQSANRPAARAEELETVGTSGEGATPAGTADIPAIEAARPERYPASSSPLPPSSDSLSRRSASQTLRAFWILILAAAGVAAAAVLLVVRRRAVVS